MNPIPTPESLELARAKAKVTDRNRLIEENERLEQIVLDITSKCHDRKLVMKEVRRTLEQLIEIEGDKMKKDYSLSTDMARCVAIIIECLGRSKGGA